MGALVAAAKKRHTKANDDKYVYRMDRACRGRFVIVNNELFYGLTQMEERRGSSVDAKALHRTFTDLGFDAVVHNNLTQAHMIDLVQQGQWLSVFYSQGWC